MVMNIIVWFLCDYSGGALKCDVILIYFMGMIPTLDQAVWGSGIWFPQLDTFLNEILGIPIFSSVSSCGPFELHVLVHTTFLDQTQPISYNYCCDKWGSVVSAVYSILFHITI